MRLSEVRGMQVTEPQGLASGYIQIVLKMLKEKIKLNLFYSFFALFDSASSPIEIGLKYHVPK